MAFWNRNRNTVDSVPEEVQEYYVAEKRQKTGIAWLLAIVTLIATILLAAFIFFAGRWVWRAAFDRDNKSSNIAQVQKQDKEKASEQSKNNSKTDSKSSNTTTRPQQPKDSETSTSQNVAEKQKPAKPETLPSDGNSTAKAPVTGDDPIPNTGPGNTLGIFALATVVGYLGHQAFMRKRAQ